ncbi:hypothetical protein F0562_027888 [Nyssa sinensis]|uniref:Uncharacterized protein n=1 Tax=Nyssa sinensis TaxID=561372 RepID=A0A5J5B6C3_9ASTE|nr:hypothetical protein F0562_027888 [Nyssa sinensis]
MDSKQPLSAAYNALHGAMNVSHPTHDSDQVTKPPLQVVLPSVVQGACVSISSETPESTTYHARTGSSSAVVVRTPKAPQKDFTPRKSSLNGGRGEGRCISGTGEWHARPMGVSVPPSIQNVFDTSVTAILPLPKATASPSSTQLAPPAVSYRDKVDDTLENKPPQQTTMLSTSTAVQSAPVHPANSKKAISWPSYPSCATVTQQPQKVNTTNCLKPLDPLPAVSNSRIVLGPPSQQLHLVRPTASF